MNITVTIRYIIFIFGTALCFHVSGQATVVEEQKISTATKIALIVANDEYRAAPWLPLTNPKSDAKLLRTELERLGFQVLTPAVNLPKKGLLKRLAEFRQLSSALPTGSMALIYYAGHGLSIGGKNYIVPVDSRIESKPDDPDGLVAVSTLLESFSASRRMGIGFANLLILDSCRVSGFGTRVPKWVTTGYSDIESIPNTFISFSASMGNIALDGNGLNSPFAISLSRALRNSDLPIPLIFDAVRKSTAELTNGWQVPEYRTSLVGNFCFSSCRRLINDPDSRSQTNATYNDKQKEHCEHCPNFVSINNLPGVKAVSQLISAKSFNACVSELACRAKSNSPAVVDRISFIDAEAYVRWLTLRSGRVFRIASAFELESVRDLVVSVWIEERTLAANGWLELTSSCDKEAGCARRQVVTLSGDPYLGLGHGLSIRVESGSEKIGFRLIEEVDDVSK